MNPRTKKKMDSINQRLAEYQQDTKLTDLTTNSLSLNNGQILYDTTASRFIKRVMNKKVTDWVKNTDALLAGSVTDDQIKNISFAIGGRACQQKHGEKIKNNLNSGTPWNKGTRGQNIGKGRAQTQLTKNKISVKNSGSGNGMYGVKLSDKTKQLISKNIKRKILLGEFTPNSNNRNTHWESMLDGILYRSSWEALYKYFNNNALYEELRLKYSYEGDSKIYIVDFIDHVCKQVIEVKPIELCVGKKFNAKMMALKKWANEESYKVLLVDQNWFKQQNIQIDYSRFDRKTALKIRKFYETSKTNRN